MDGAPGTREIRRALRIAALRRAAHALFDEAQALTGKADVTHFRVCYPGTEWPQGREALGAFLRDVRTCPRKVRMHLRALIAELKAIKGEVAKARA